MKARLRVLKRFTVSARLLPAARALRCDLENTSLLILEASLE